MKTETLELKVGHIYKEEYIMKDGFKWLDIFEVIADKGDWNDSNLHETSFPMKTQSLYPSRKMNHWKRFVEDKSIIEFGKIEDHPEYFI